MVQEPTVGRVAHCFPLSVYSVLIFEVPWGELARRLGAKLYAFFQELPLSSNVNPETNDFAHFSEGSLQQILIL